MDTCHYCGCEMDYPGPMCVPCEETEREIREEEAFREEFGLGGSGD